MRARPYHPWEGAKGLEGWKIYLPAPLTSGRPYDTIPVLGNLALLGSNGNEDRTEQDSHDGAWRDRVANLRRNKSAAQAVQ